MGSTIFKKTKFIYRAYRYRYHIDKQEIAYLIESVKPGETIADIGAHKGGYLYWFQKRVGANGKCYAFEPQSKLFNYLTESKELLNYENVILENLGMSSSTGDSQIFVPEDSETSPSATLNPDHNDDSFLSYNIKTDTLDNYFYNNEIYPTFLKIDVEGHEFDVLKGGKKLITYYSPTILMECESRHLKNHSVYDVFEFLTDVQYHGYFFLKGNIIPIENFDPQVHQNYGGKGNYVNNFLFKK